MRVHLSPYHLSFFIATTSPAKMAPKNSRVARCVVAMSTAESWHTAIQLTNGVLIWWHVCLSCEVPNRYERPVHNRRETPVVPLIRNVRVFICFSECCVKAQRVGHSSCRLRLGLKIGVVVGPILPFPNRPS